jgi:GTP pyrophosphokinase
MDVETVLERAGAYLPESDLDLIRRAYACTAEALAEPPQAELRTDTTYTADLDHALNIAHTLADLGLDAQTLAAGMLYVAVDQDGLEAQALENIDAEVVRLVTGLVGLAGLDPNIGERDGQRSDRQIENLRKMFLAMARDPRVVLIMLADRLHTLHTLRHSEDSSLRQRLARETLDIFAPLAGRLGIYRLKWALEDLGFRFQDPLAYDEIAGKLSERRQDREQQVNVLIERIQQALAAEGIPEAHVAGRPKHIYSINKKMQRKGVPFEQIYDVRAVRIIVQTVPQCYHALGVIHHLWHPLPRGFDDYIASPKDNSYQSLHTDVLADDGKTLEVQIRTQEMHELAEFGIAAHWKYKERGSSAARADQVYEEKIKWLQSALGVSPEDQDTPLDEMTRDLLGDQVYVFTPRGEAIELPKGSTPVDFAYAIHTEVGHRCRGARVNGRLVSLDRTLENGDQVEILTSKRGGPSRDWLVSDLGFVHTARARTKIRQWFRLQDRDQNIERGRELVDKELRRLGLDRKLSNVASLFRLDSADEFYARVGTGDIQPSTVGARVAAKLTDADQEQELELPPPAPAPHPDRDTGVRVASVGDLMTKLAPCCTPAPGDAIVGYITRGRGVTIHRQDCPNVVKTISASAEEQKRLIEVSWGDALKTYPVRVSIRAYDRKRLLRDIIEVLSNEEVSMSGANIATHREKNLATFSVVLELTDISQLSRVLSRLEQVPSVLEARRMAG